jgi:predicted histidine transporter YuiF (NhaC family)
LSIAKVFDISRIAQKKNKNKKQKQKSKNKKQKQENKNKKAKKKEKDNEKQICFIIQLYIKSIEKCSFMTYGHLDAYESKCKIQFLKLI